MNSGKPRRYWLLAGLSVLLSTAWSQNTLKSPHGELSYSCADCHASSSLDRYDNKGGFKHEQTRFSLTGKHEDLSCKDCHTSLRFKQSSSRCASCHTDIHREQLGSDCQRCHTTQGWQAHDKINQVHRERNFPLIGAHQQIDCDACHTGQKEQEYAQTRANCLECHGSKYSSTTNPNHKAAGFSSDCQECHGRTFQTWGDALFQHTNELQLKDRHQSLTCQECHQENYKGLSQACLQCHQKDYEATQEPAHGKLNYPKDCALCHDQKQWRNATFEHSNLRFALTGAHQNLDCIDCHSAGYKNTPITCNACHQDDYDKTVDPNHQLGAFDLNCTSCHSAVSWKPSGFEHNTKTTYALTSAHQSVNCAGCHSTQFKGTSNQCFNCHDKNFQSAANPNHVSNQFDHNCSLCHNDDAWKPARFDHAATSFPLTNGHQNLTCIECHAAGYQNTSSTCYSCHQDDYDRTTDPNHKLGEFDQTCTSCHSTTSWKPSSFDHNSKTSYALSGVHQQIYCSSCHSKQFKGTPTECFSCHDKNFQSVMSPNHVSNQFDHNCSLCHNDGAWKPVRFDHNTTSFPLSGGHQNRACIDCHAAGYTNTPTACYACHQDDYDKTTDPNHRLGQFDQTCTTCHSTAAWTPSGFDHNSKTTYALTGAHQAINCASCHSAQFKGTATQCYGCHQADFQGAYNPNHVNNQFDQNCTACHSNTAWTPSTFDHMATTFPLTGGHQNRACIDCHAAGYVNTPTACYACHQDDYDKTTDPNHKLGQFDQTCTTCHSTAAWTPSGFDHNSKTTYALTGAHQAINCASIAIVHNLKAQLPSATACHEKDFQSVVLIQYHHVSNNQFDHNCIACHSNIAWTPSTFDHTATTFPLTGGHQNRACIDCHAAGYVNTPTACYACHQDDYDKTTDPNHKLGQFDQTCTTCHSTAAWTPSGFDHNSKTTYALTGAHQSINCASCHSAQFKGTATQCYGCHEKDFQSVADPNHVSNQFDHNCIACHSNTAWTPSTFDHMATTFPLTGGHQNRACIDCHAAGYVNTPTTCYACHQTDYNATIDPDHEIGQFDQNCLTCHNNTAWTPSGFDHNSKTTYALTGAHQAINCAACHSAQFKGTATQCYGCHQADFQSGCF